ncbi:MAG: hypothetical protein ACRDT8_15875 [Micromonosporaceae bacterium]
MIDEIRNVLNEIQVALAGVNDRCEHATAQTQQAKATAEQLGSVALAGKVEDLQHAIVNLQQQVAHTQTGAALACHNANEAANAS